MEKIIIAQLSVKEDCRQQFMEAAKIMVEKSNAEKGCLFYRLLNEVAKPNEFVFFEKYINQEAIDFHNSSEHFKSFVELIAELLSSEPKIDVY